MSNKDNKIPSLFREPEVLNVGYGNFVLAHRIIAVLESGSLPMKRLRESAARTDRLMDATAGRKTRSLVVMDSCHVILSALAPHTLQERLQQTHGTIPQARIELEGGEFVS